MRTSKLMVATLLLVSISLVAQKKVSTASTKSAPQKVIAKNDDKAADEKKVRDMIAFLQYMLNTLGSSATPARDKDVLITESYSKIFRDSKVQIEDDLDNNRAVVTNKDIVAYLKDVNFFFKDAKFEFTIENIERSLLPSGEVFYKVSAKRNLTATTIEKEKINNTIPRYIEINYNPKEDDLKIVSLYTSGIDEKRSLTNWWNDLSYEWKNIFSRKLSLKDSVSLQDIKAIHSIKELDIGSNTYVNNIEPLGSLAGLKKLDLSGTTIVDLSPLRNLTELTYLDLSNTSVKDLTPLKYSTRIETLNLSNTLVYNINVIEKMSSLKEFTLKGLTLNNFSSIGNLLLLQTLNLNSTNIQKTEILSSLEQLKDLNLANTLIQDLSGLSGLPALQYLNIDSTHIRDLQPLSNLQNLKQLSINFTPTDNLQVLLNLKSLEKVYCDQTAIKQKDADQFQQSNPKTLIIFDSNDLKIWWETIGPDWQKIFVQATAINSQPSKEELAKVQLLDSINVSGSSKVRDFYPLKKLIKLKTIVANKTNVVDLTPIGHLKEVTYLDISYTKISNLNTLKEFKNLKILKAENTNLDGVESLSLPGLSIFYADHSNITDSKASDFLLKNPNCLLIYKTEHLQSWWQSLSYEWKSIFDKSGDFHSSPENLHKLVEQPSFQIQDASITNLSGLNEFIRLEKLSVSGTMMNSITPLNRLTNLKSLKVSGSPIREIDSLYVLSELEELDISNTPIEDIFAIWKLKKLKSLNCSGTQIKHINILEKLENLEYLDCSNTNVNKLNALDYIPLKVLKCYNTRLSARSIESFKGSHPNCDVQFYR